MQHASRGRAKIFIIIGITVAMVGGWFLYQNIQSGTITLPPLLKISGDSAKPTLTHNLAQSGVITPEAGGVIRAIDADGIVSTLKVPAGAVREEVTVTLTPFTTSETDIHYGVQVTPENLQFLEPVTLSFNWRLSEQNAYTKRPYLLQYVSDSQSIETVPAQRALVVKNYMPALLTQGGWYGVTDDVTLALRSAKLTLTQSEEVLNRLDAGLTLLSAEELSSSQQKGVQEDIDAVLNDENPDLNELYLAIMLQEGMKEKVSFIQTVHAYGLLDGYLQFRCNLPETTYEDAMVAMATAAQLGYAEVEKTCREKAEQLLLERAELVNGDPNRPLIDAVEVLQQMQVLGLDDTGRGSVLAEQLTNDIITSLTGLEEGSDGRERPDTPSDDPLLTHNSTIIQEMLGIQVTQLIGIDSFDEAGLKKFGENMHSQLSGLNMVVDELCNLDELMPGFREMGAQMGMLQEFDDRCETVQSGRLQQGIDVWQNEVDDMAEGVDSVQRGETPNSGWDEMPNMDRYLE